MTYPAKLVRVAISQQNRDEALSKLNRARLRNDTRAIARAQYEVDRATLAAIRAEIEAGVVR